MAPYFRPETPLRSARIRSAGKAVNDDTKIKHPGVRHHTSGAGAA
jgi:hypothetical protein